VGIGQLGFCTWTGFWLMEWKLGLDFSLRWFKYLLRFIIGIFMDGDSDG